MHIWLVFEPQQRTNIIAFHFQIEQVLATIYLVSTPTRRHIACQRLSETLSVKPLRCHSHLRLKVFLRTLRCQQLTSFF